MKPEIVLQHEFVEFIPAELKEGILYISIRFATVSHLCPCGCRNKVVTPLKPTDWMLIFDGKTISLRPSIGNWSFPCRSHYWVRRNKVRWAGDWSEEKIEAARGHYRRLKERYWEAQAPQSVPGEPDQKPARTKKTKRKARAKR
ncbi:MAG: DUF6527 family protein [Candidatus Binataceae bacterium]